QPPLRLPLRLAVAMVVLLAVVVVFGSGAVSVSNGAGAKTVPLLTVGIPHPVNTLDTSSDVSSLPYVSAMGLETLFRVKPFGKLTPVLATSLAQRGRDNLIVHLRKGVKFWDGNDMTSADVANTLNYYRYPTSQLAFYFKSVRSVVVLDRYTIE